MQEDYIINCKNISKYFSTKQTKLQVLKSVNLSIKKGEFLMLEGPSGCGKTTLISIIAGILAYEQGSCSVIGHEYQQMAPKDLIKFRAQNIGFVFQAFNLIPTIKVIENVALPLIINGANFKQALPQSKSMLSNVGLEEHADTAPEMLSGGQQQRVAIARALIHNPAIIICDEPTSALDYQTGIKIMDLLHEINQKYHTTFIIVTHDGRILKYADRVVRLNDGIIEQEEKGDKSG